MLAILARQVSRIRANSLSLTRHPHRAWFIHFVYNLRFDRGERSALPLLLTLTNPEATTAPEAAWGGDPNPDIRGPLTQASVSPEPGGEPPLRRVHLGRKADGAPLPEGGRSHALRGRDVIHYVDNFGALACLVKGDSRNPDIGRLAH
eukprot:scaffold8434_cov112-Isochrysis_galbana.AAC.4